MKLLILGLFLTVWSLSMSAPVNNTTTQTKGIIFPKKLKENNNMKEKMEEQKKVNQKDVTTSASSIKSTEVTTESSKTSSPPYVPLTVDEEFVKFDGSSVSNDQVETTLVPLPETEKEDQSSSPEESLPMGIESSEIPPESLPVPDHAPDGLIEYNLGNPLALRLHLPWWPLKDMLKSIQDAISFMNLTMSEDTMDVNNTKTKVVKFDDRNYTLKVRVLKPHENNRLLVRLISLTPVIEEGKIPMEKGAKVEEEKKNEALDGSIKKPFSQMKQKEDEEEEKKDDDDDKKEEKSKGKESKERKKEEQKEESDSD